MNEGVTEIKAKMWKNPSVRARKYVYAWLKHTLLLGEPSGDVRSWGAVRTYVRAHKGFIIVIIGATYTVKRTYVATHVRTWLQGHYYCHPWGDVFTNVPLKRTYVRGYKGDVSSSCCCCCCCCRHCCCCRCRCRCIFRPPVAG